MPLNRHFELSTWSRAKGLTMTFSDAEKPYLLATIDFEASSLHPKSEAIEVGLAFWRRGEAIKTWSSLIRPSPAAVWSAEAAAIHGITQRDLSLAPHPTEVARKLNALMEHSSVAYCDGGEWDERWLRQLFEATGVTPAFRLMSYHRMPGLRIQSVFNRMSHFLKTTKPPHRAGDDAVRLMHAYAYAKGQSPDVVSL